MKVMNIKNAVFKKLKDNFPNNELYGEKVKQGFKRPAFFIEIKPISNELCNKYLTERHISIDITYIPDRDNNQEAEDNLIMADKLDDLFVGPLRILDRNLIPQNNRNEIEESMLHYSFDFIFFDDSFYEEPSQPAAGKINVNLVQE